MSVAISVGVIHDAPFDIAWRVQRLTRDSAVAVWLDDQGIVHASQADVALVGPTPTMFVGTYKPGVDAGRIEDDLRTAFRERGPF